MKNTFYRPEKLNCQEFDRIIHEMRDSLTELVSGQAKKEEVIQYVQRLIKEGKELPKDPELIFWGFDEPENMPSDSRVLYFYTPTYIAASFLAYVRKHGPMEALLLEGFDETLRKGLNGCAGRGFSGSGHDGLKGLIDALFIFTSAQLHEFVQSHPEVSPKFTSIFLDVKRMLEDKLQTGKVMGGWGEDFTRVAKEVVHRMKDMEEKHLIFVYGTLLFGHRNHEPYLKDSQYLGEATLSGYALYNLGSYPGVKRMASEKVKGEVYAVDDETLSRINELEGEGSLYALNKTMVEMGGQMVPGVGVYVYLHAVKEENLVEEKDQPWRRRTREVENLVWYAAYGSNMLHERFLCYIKGGAFRNQGRDHKPCADPSLPKAKTNYELPHPMYFANRSGSWDNKGVSFLDVTRPGKAYGVAYLITREQFEHLFREENEGNVPGPDSLWYNRKAELGTLHGIPVMTVTNRNALNRNEPGERYLQVLKEGLRENYPNFTESDIHDYLQSRNR